MKVQTLVITTGGVVVDQAIMDVCHRGIICGLKVVDTKTYSTNGPSLPDQARDMGATVPINRFTAMLYVVEESK